MKTAAIVVRFFRDLRGSVPREAYSDVMDNPTVEGLGNDARALLHNEASASLREGRLKLKDLQNIFRLIAEPSDRKKLITELQELCINQPSQIPSELAEWIGRESEVDAPRRRRLIPADKSQSSDLNYVVVSLLDAWDASADDDRSSRSLDSIQR